MAVKLNMSVQLSMVMQVWRASSSFADRKLTSPYVRHAVHAFSACGALEHALVGQDREVP
jgi:hypothetical protein